MYRYIQFYDVHHLMVIFYTGSDCGTMSECNNSEIVEILCIFSLLAR